jgi:hypothetical protein
MDGSEAFPLARVAQWMSRLILSFVKCSLSVSFHLYRFTCIVSPVSFHLYLSRARTIDDVSFMHHIPIIPGPTWNQFLHAWNQFWKLEHWKQNSYKQIIFWKHFFATLSSLIIIIHTDCNTCCIHQNFLFHKRIMPISHARAWSKARRY